METRSYLGVEYMRSGALVLLREMAQKRHLQADWEQRSFKEKKRLRSRNHGCLIGPSVLALSELSYSIPR